MHAGYEIAADFQLKKVYRVDPLNEVLDWLSQDPYPTQQQLDTWEAEAQALRDSALLVKEEISTIQNYAALAKQYASQLRLIIIAVADSDAANSFAGETFDAAFLRFTGANVLGHASVSAGFRAFVMSAFTKETGLSFPMTAQGISNAPAATRQAFNAFLRRFINFWAALLLVSQ